MKLLGGLLGLIIAVVVAGFVYLSVADVHIAQTDVSKPVQMNAQPNGAQN